MDAKFTTTQWSLVRAAADSANPECREALSSLCRTYWFPVYAYVRFRGNDSEAARELTQGFFAFLLDKKSVKAARPERGRFRTFLLTSVKNYLANERDRALAWKRGAGAPVLSLDFETAESTLKLEPQERETPETIFERRWAVSVLRQAMARLERETQQAEKTELFRQLKPFLVGEGRGRPYSDVAADLEMTEPAVKVAIHRLRRKFGRLLREEVSQTLSDPALLDEEMRFLRGALSS